MRRWGRGGGVRQGGQIAASAHVQSVNKLRLSSEWEGVLLKNATVLQKHESVSRAFLFYRRGGASGCITLSSNPAPVADS